MAFNLPQQLSLKTLPVVSTTDWVRPVDWPTITDVAGEIQFLVSDSFQGAYAINTTFTGAGNLYIDWGDGVIDTISTSTDVTTLHQYTVGTGTPCSQGYTTWKIRVYGDPGVVPTKAMAVVNPNYYGGSAAGMAQGYLEAVYGNGTITSIQYLWGGFLFSFFAQGGGFYPQLQYVKLPTVITGTAANYAFYFCPALSKIVMPTSMPNVQNCDQMFNITNLKSIVLPSDMTAVTSAQFMFNSSRNLETVVLPASWNSCANIQNIFSVCPSLRSVVMPTLGSCLTFTSAFALCYGLIQVTFTGFHTSPGQTLTMSNMFNNCTNIQNIYFPTTVASGTLFSSLSFSGLASLLSVIFPSNVDFAGATALSNLFANCSSLLEVVMPQINLTQVNTLNATFQNCFALQSVTLFPSASNTLTVSNTFNACRALGTITIPNAWNLNSVLNAFNNCSNIRSITLPQNAQNSLANLSQVASNTEALETILFPTSLGGVNNTFNGSITNCQNLKTVVFPATVGFTTFAAAINNCPNLISVTLPTSLPSLTATGLNNCPVNNCASLQTLVYPATVPATLTSLGTINSLYSLTTLTFPTTQITSLTTMPTFTSCFSLKTINNINKLGPTTTNLTWDMGQTPSLESLSFTQRIAKFTAKGTSATDMYNLNSLRFTNTVSGQWTGTSPQISIAYTRMSTAALVTLFNDLAAQGSVVGKTIDITGSVGAAGLSAGDRAIITSIGWTITG